MKNKECSALMYNVSCIMILVACVVFPVKGKFKLKLKVVNNAKEIDAHGSLVC